MDIYERRSILVIYMLMIGITGLLLNGCIAFPQFDKEPSYVKFEENDSTPIGTLLFTLRATDTGNPLNQMNFYTEDKDTIFYVNIIPLSHTSPAEANITLKNKLDRESNEGGIQLKFKLTDAKGNTIQKVVQIFILDACDEPPQFERPSYILEIDEMNITGKIIVFSEIQAPDRDNGANAIVTYRMEPNTKSVDYWTEIYKETFSIEPTNGSLYLLTNLDYENNSFYQFTLYAKDTCNLTAVPANLTIRVKDVQDKPPFFIGLPYMRNIVEDNYNNVKILTVEAFDGDVGIPNKIKYSIVDTSECSEKNSTECIFCRKLFSINSSTGDITVTGILDWLMQNVLDIYGICNIAVEATEITQGNKTQMENTQSKTNVTVKIVDKNNHCPKFEKISYTAQIDENASENTPVLLCDGAAGINIFDKDQGMNSKFNVTLQCEKQTDCQTFAVVPSNAIFRDGVVSIRVKNNSLLDYEKRKYMIITVIAMEYENQSHTNTATVTVQIGNVNEFPPKFKNETYIACIEEEVGNGTTVINITATDNDTGEYGNIAYSLSGDNNLFSVNNKTGEVVTNCKTTQLNREERSKIYLTIIAADGGGRMNQAQLIVSLVDKNDNPPLFQQEIYTAFLDENKTKFMNTSFLRVKATDADDSATKNSEVSYKIGNNIWKSNFTINTTTGEIRLISPLDYEALHDTDQGVINLTIVSYDHGNPALSDNVTVTIFVQDLNDNAPIFSEGNYNGSIKEIVKNDIYVGMVRATDADKTERNNKILFAIEAGGYDKFRIDSTTGNVTVQVGAQFDREDINLYNLTIIAIDQGEAPHTTTAIMSVTIEDVNNKPPKFNQSFYSIRVLEDMENGSNLTNCIAIDPDENPSLIYNISGIIGWNENDGIVNQSIIETYFRIENGTVYVNACLDREKVEKLEVTLMVHDINEVENKPQTSTATLTVTLLDVNDNDPVFIRNEQKDYYETNVSENANNPTILMSVSATDTDKNRTITYQIIHSTLKQDAFKIDPNTGELSKIGHVDREDDSTVNLTVLSKDNGYPSRNSTIKVLITILDFNDNTPQFLDHNDYYHVLENMTNGTIIVTINATDCDEGDNGRVVYDIENAKDVPFKINRTTGTISVSGTLDREKVQDHRYSLTILAKDDPKNKALQRINRITLTVLLDDVNDNDPVFSNRIFTSRTLENTAINSTIFTVTATDADEGNNANVTFSIANETNAGGYFGIFNTGNNEGRVFIAQGLDDQEEWRNITVIATDHGTPQRSSQAILHIAILDVNLKAPELISWPNRVTVFECARISTKIFSVHATDKDKTSPNKDVHYNMSIIQPQTNTDIGINSSTGDVFVAAKLNVANISSYKVQVMAVDQGTPNLTSPPVTIDIVVEDVNDQPPSFVNKSFSFSVEEGQENKTIDRVVATDPDTNSTSCYHLMDLRYDYGDYFTINKTGYIVVKKALDRENKSQQVITFEVQVYDCTVAVNVSYQCGEYYTQQRDYIDKANVTITVLDIDDNRPSFTKRGLRAGLRTKTEPEKEILELKKYVSDMDLPKNAMNKWFFETVSFTLSQELAKMLNGQTSGKRCNDMLCVTGNGTIVNNMWYTQDMSGFFNLSVRVNDSAGNDTTYILIFLIADSQVLKMTILGNRTTVASTKDDILSECGKETDLSFVYDSIADHITDDGSVETFKTDLFFHIDDPVNNKVLSAEEAKRLLDINADKLYDVRLRYSIINIESSLKTGIPNNESTKTIYVMAAVIALLALVILIGGYMFFSSSSRYKRKLRAAMPMEKEMNVLKNTDFAIPGCNKYANSKNPLMNVEPAPPEYDDIDATSHNSLDENEVDDTKTKTVKEELEEREATMDMYGEDYNSMPTLDPLEAALREHDARRQASMHKHGDSKEAVDYSDLHESELETSDI